VCDVKSDVEIKRNAYAVKRVRLRTQMQMSGSLDRRAPVRQASVRIRQASVRFDRRRRKIEMKGRISFNKRHNALLSDYGLFYTRDVPECVETKFRGVFVDQ
jgi:hypothetical protein